MFTAIARPAASISVRYRLLIGAALTAFLPGCGSPTRADDLPLSVVTTQHVAIGVSEFRLSWSGATGPYQVTIGTAAGLADVVNTETSAESFTWTANGAGPYFATVRTKTRPPFEVRLTPVDLRDVID